MSIGKEWEFRFIERVGLKGADNLGIGWISKPQGPKSYELAALMSRLKPRLTQRERIFTR